MCISKSALCYSHSGVGRFLACSARIHAKNTQIDTDRVLQPLLRMHTEG